MPLSLCIGSFVAGSRVGIGVAPFVLAPRKIDPVLFPTTLLGHHPGWGPPGGGATPDALLEGMIEGVAANGLFELTDAIYTGYFANAGQVRIAAGLIDAVRAARGDRPCRVLVDPVMGDDPYGLYVPDAVAASIAADLVPRADLLTPNAWEAQRLSGVPVSDADSAAAAARAIAKPCAVTSIRQAGRIGAVWTDEKTSVYAGAPEIAATDEWRPPHGTGDVFALFLQARLIEGASPQTALADAVSAVSALMARARNWRAPELPLAACQDLFSA